MPRGARATRPSPAPIAPPSAWARFLESPAALVAVLCLAAAVRVLHVLELRDGPWFVHLVVDPDFYDRWASRIAAGDWLGDRPFYLDPLYPYFLAVLYRLFGRDLLLIRLAQVALSVATCALVVRLATSVGRSLGASRPARPRTLGLVAGLAFALYEPDVFFVAEVEKTTLSVLATTAFLTAFVVALERPASSLLPALSGLALGLASLTRANLLVFAPLGAVALALPGRPGDAPARAEASRAWRGAAAFLLGVAFALAPVAWRNHRVSGEWVLTTAQSGQNFYVGNNPWNPYGAFAVLPFVRPNPDFEEHDFRAEAERRSGRPLSAGEVSRFWWREGLRHAAESPGYAALATARKLALFWNDFEISDNQDQYVLERDSAVMRWPLPGFGVVAALAVLGAVVGFRRSRAVRLLVGFTAVYCASVVAFFLFSRYRIQVIPALLPLAAVGAAELAAAVRARLGRRLVRDVAVVGAMGAFSLQTIGIFSASHPLVVDMQLRKLAEQWQIAGRPDQALAVYREALQRCPGSCPDTLASLVDVALASGRAREAAAIVREEVLRRRPDDAAAREALVRLGGGTASGGASPGHGERSDS